MAYQHNGRGHQGHYGNYQASSTPQSQYGAFAAQPLAQNQYLQRTPSFDHGDDNTYPVAVNGGGGGQTYGTRSYRAGSAATMQNEGLDFQNSAPTNSTTYAAPVGGYQHQDFAQAPGTHPSYNPQQYGTAQPQPQYTPQPVSGTNNSFSAGYQPYIPAAYQPAPSQYQLNQENQLQHSFSNRMSPRIPSQPPPPLPQRPYEHRYGNPASPQIGTAPTLQHHNLGQESSYQQPSLPPIPNSAPLPSRSQYTPPAPPPPPFLPDRDVFTTSTSSAASQRRSSQRMSSFQSTLPYQQHSTQNQLPPLPAYSSNGSSSIGSPNPNTAQNVSPFLGLNDSLPPTPGTPGPTPPQHSPQRSNTTGRHPQDRPLPGPPSHTDYFGGRIGQSNNYDSYDEEPAFDDIMKDIEAAIMPREQILDSRRTTTSVHSQRQMNENQEPELFLSTDSDTDNTHDNTHRQTNGHTNALGTGQYINYDAYSDKSDAEAEAGLAAMHIADKEDAAEELRRNSGADLRPESYAASQNSRFDDYPAELSSDSDVRVDMDTYGGGFSGHVHYGDQPVSQPGSQANLSDRDYQHRPSLGTSSLQRSDVSSDSLDMRRDIYDYSIPNQDDIHPFPPTIGARVDTGGTGGLAEPSSHMRRLSFEDGDEITLAESEGAYTSATQSPSGEGMPDMFFHPSVNPNRPLPAAPVGSYSRNRVPQLLPAGTYQHPERLLQYDQHSRPSYPPAPDAYNQLLSPSGTPVPRSSSLISHGSAPQTVAPLRSKTDADRARLKQQQLMGLRSASVYGETPDSSVPQSAELLGLPEIPAGRRKKFNPSKLSSQDFKKCPEPWALSSIVAWIKEMSEGEADLKEHAIVDGIVALFTHKVPTMNTADAETLGARVVRAMFDSGTLVKEEEWVKFGTEAMSGVLFQMTGTGCYSPRVHRQTLPGRCYAHHCMRTLKKINLQTQALEPQRKVEDWATFYKVPKATIEAANKKDVERQNILHEVVTTEDSYMDQLNVLRMLYRDELAKSQPPIITPKKIEGFLRDVFGKADAIKQVNEDHLLSQLKYRQQEQGPWIVGFSDIFREWIRKAKTAYIGYAESFPNATFLVRQEAERNFMFREFLDVVRENERSKRLGWDTYLKAPITRLQRYTLLLSTIAKNMLQDSEEKTNLKVAIDEIKAVTLDCDMRVAEMSKKVELTELASKLVLRTGMEKVHLNLTHLGREIIFKGDLQRAGSNKFTWLETHAILFDHYMVLSKRTVKSDAAGGLKQDKYDVSKLPIPMDLLVLESTNDDPVVKTAMNRLGAVTKAQPQTSQSDTRLSRASISNPNGAGGPGTLAHVNTSSSAASISTTSSSKTIATATVLEGPKDEKLMFPFKIKHLGKSELYVLYAPSQQNRQDWCDKIIEAKTRHAASLFKQGAEPFRLRVIADTAFGYDATSGSSKGMVIRGTPLDRAIREVENAFAGAGARPGPVCRAQVNCAAAFNQPFGNPMIAVGTDYGVFISDYNNPRGWFRAITIKNVTQIAILEEFSLFLLISEKSLISYHLDSVCPSSGPNAALHASDASSRRAPQKLSGTRDVGFFATGRMKDRTLVFYKKREGISSTFKVLEPIYQKSSTSTRSRFGIRKGTTEFFRDFDDFYIPSDTYAINLFHSSLSIATAKGFEVMTLDKKIPISIPDLKPPDCASIAHRIRDQKPLGMFRLSDSEFLLVFEEVGIYVNKHGDVSRAVVMEFVGKAQQAVLYGGKYLILVDRGGAFVEVRNAVNGRLRQVVSGKDVRLLDDGIGTGTGIPGGMGGRGTVKICMQHPEYERSQIVVEMIVKEGSKE